jgi:hypothetical protein
MLVGLPIAVWLDLRAISEATLRRQAEDIGTYSFAAGHSQIRGGDCRTGAPFKLGRCVHVKYGSHAQGVHRSWS